MSVHVRLIPVLTLKDGRIIKTVQFDRYHDIGHPVTMGKVFDSQDVDELVFLDIAAGQENREPAYDTIEAFAEETTMPLTIGGGIRTTEQIQRLLNLGADKIAINTSAVADPKFIRQGAEMFGSQCIVVSIDAIQREGARYEVLISGGYEATGLDVVDWAKKVENMGAGEILLTSVDRDGTMDGFDIELIRMVADAVKIPVIASGGCGLLIDLVDAVNQGHASAVAASSIFAFTDNKPMKATSFMQTQGVHVRPI
jgi:imidazole glycerol-phosphate synthase subunit HisF